MQQKYPIGSTVSNTDLAKPAGSCNVQPSSKFDGAAQALTEAEKTADQIGVPPERLLQMQTYAAQLRRKHPHMKEARLTRKVAEHFKVKLT